jgi:hypothetical protein
MKKPLKQCINTIPKENTWKYVNMNPRAPNLHATVKLHTPVVNWKGAYAYELIKHLTKALHSYLHLPYTNNVHNSVHLITDLQTIKHLITDLQTITLNKIMQICSFSILNVHSSIPKQDTINIISNILKSNPEINKNIQSKHFTYNKQ